MNTNEILVNESASLEEAMRRIDKNERGIVFVVDDDRTLLGTATDGDIRREIIDGGDLATPVSAVMNTDPVFIREEWSEREVNEHVSAARLRSKLGDNQRIHVPVVNGADEVVDVAMLSRDGALVEEPSPSNGAVDSVLVIGGAGYVGSVLSGKLLERGYEVRVLDNLLYGDHGIERYRDHDRFTLFEGDMRSIENVVEGIQDVDAVVHLGALVGEPATSLTSRRTLELNLHAVKLAAQICKYHQINRFLFASTCSVYGQSATPAEPLTEQSRTNPVSLYAKTKLESERALLDLADENFSPTILRMATIYGLSPRMRFDLVVNVLTAKAFDEGTIPIFGGDQYRPNVHVADAAKAYIDCLEAPIDDVAGEVFNVGSNEQNYQISSIGRIVADEFPNAQISWEDQEDERSYCVDFGKIHERLDYGVDRTVSDGCSEIKRTLQSGRITDYTAEKYSNYKTLEDNLGLLRTG